MRAKKVYESFKRGLDPKEAMGIGQIEKIKREMENENQEWKGKDRALIWASGKGYKDYVMYLLEAEANIHAEHEYALRWASEKGHKDVVEVLLKAGANVHALDDEALRWASENGHKEVEELLKKYM